MVSGVLSLSLVLHSCASTGELLAGPKDTAPPVLDSVMSTVNYQTRFTKQDIVFVFDEFVEVKDAFKQVLVSPPLVYLPKVTGRGKKVTFAFHKDEVLRPDVTYTINFGEAIVDFREGNKLKNFSFVFSTGDVLDSLSLEGMVYDAKTLQPAENVQILIYDRFYDSIVVKERPYYTVKTDKSGQFICRNIKADTFAVLGLMDNNVNLRYDLETEKIAFLDSLIVLTDSTAKNPLTFYISTPLARPKLLVKNTKTRGFIELIYNRLPDTVTLTTSMPDIQLFQDKKSDTLHLYYQTEADSFDVFILKDTIRVKPPGKETLSKLPKLVVASHNLSPNLLPTDSLRLTFSVPVTQAHIDSIVVSDTIGIVDGINFSWSENRKNLYVKGKWRTSMPYTLRLDSAVVTDMYARALDSTGYSFSFLPADKTSGLSMVFEGFDSLKHYHILVYRGNVLFDRFSFSDSRTFTKNYKVLVPDVYTIEVIQDENQNGRWDPADYWHKKQPEKMKTVKTERLEVNRVNDFRVVWTEDSLPSDATSLKK